MDKRELGENHMIKFKTALPGADVFDDMAKISIQYAIEVLEEIDKAHTMVEAVNMVHDKIEQLKKLI